MAPHQQDFVRWRSAGDARTRGAILGDAPGLGKTVQAVAVVAQAVAEAGHGHRILVVAPANVVAVWAAEFARFAPSIPVVTGGLGLESAPRVFTRLGGREGRVVAVMSHEVMRIHSHILASSGTALDLLVVDEAHRFKNVRAVGTKALHALAARRRLLLTATALSNNVEELRGLLALAHPAMWSGRRDFDELFARPIELARREDATADQQVLGDLVFGHLQDEVAGVYLRRDADRLKRDLPALQTFVVVVRATPLQDRVLRALAASGAATGTRTRQALEYCGALRQVCANPLLQMRSGAAGDAAVRGELTRTPDDAGNVVKLSGTLQAVAAMLDAALTKTNRKIVVVGEWRRPLDFLRAYLSKTHPDVQVATMCGGTKKGDRTKRLRDLNTGDLRVLLLTKGICEGITCTGASILIDTTPSWNPTKDTQALGRIHRLGQTRDCIIYRVVLRGSIEELILLRQAEKSSLCALLDGGSFPSATDSRRAGVFEMSPAGVRSRIEEGAGRSRAGTDPASACEYADPARWLGITPLYVDDGDVCLRALKRAVLAEFVPPGRGPPTRSEPLLSFVFKKQES